MRWTSSEPFGHIDPRSSVLQASGRAGLDRPLTLAPVGDRCRAGLRTASRVLGWRRPRAWSRQFRLRLVRLPSRNSE